MSASYTHQWLLTQGQITPSDFEEIWHRRRVYNRLGFAYQLIFVKLFNRFPTQHPLEIDDEVLLFVSAQLGLDATEIADYACRRETVSEHQERIRQYLDLRRFSEQAEVDAGQFIFDEACRLEQTAALLARLRDHLKTHRILEPAEDTLRRLIQTQREAARKHIYQRIAHGLTDERCHDLDALLQPDEGPFSRLHLLKQSPARPSPAALTKLTEKLQQIEASGILNLDLFWLNNNFQRALARYVRRCSASRLRRLRPERRYAALVCFLHQLYRDTTDDMVDTYDKLISRLWNRAQNDLNAHARQQRKQVRNSLANYRALLDVLLDDAVKDTALRPVLFSRVERDELVADAAEMVTLLDGKYSHVFHLVAARHSYLRQFAPALLRHLRLEPEDSPSATLFEAVDLLREMNKAGRRKLPADAPMDFMPRGIRTLVTADGDVDKRAWECALLTAVRDGIKSGNVSVQGSKRFGSLTDFFMDDQQWATRRAAFFERAGLPVDAQEARTYLTRQLRQAYDTFLERLPENAYAQVDDQGWRLSTDTAERLDDEAVQRLAALKNWLGQRVRVVRLPELLIEVDNDLRYSRHFMTAAEQQELGPDHVCAVLATIMAHGCNIGPYTMSHLTPDVSYNRIKHLTDWMLTEEAQRAALASVVNAISRLDLTSVWGEGKTSSSDGQRFAFRRRVLQQTYSTKFSDFAIEFYSFVADNYAPYYSTPIACTDRDAPYVLDGLLYNESDLPLHEHYTDTHGYTENNFAAFAMLGRRFAPRIRGLQKQRIYRIDRERDYGPLAVLVSPSDRTIHLEWIIDQWDRLGQFYASLESGHTTASVAMKRLNGFTGKNHFYRANRELGRIFKTEHILEYMSDQELRRRMRRGLLKGEQIHALARDLNYGKRGRITKRDWLEQRTSSSCLTLILAAIIYWQAKEIECVLSTHESEQAGLDLTLVEHISPITWDNVILYGEYVLDRNLVKL